MDLDTSITIDGSNEDIMSILSLFSDEELETTLNMNIEAELYEACALIKKVINLRSETISEEKEDNG